jgi:transcription-repair coupling factor (superfamily II helicase)
MDGEELEKVMLTFIRGEADILVSTTIIESGIDIPSANTMIIADADRFGLAELHQLRGRVGRSKHRAYCYLLLPEDRPLTEPAKKRLQAIEQYSMLGAGFKIAMRDLEIRGAGNILGPEQSGHIAAVGYEMYCQLLDSAVRDLRNEAPPTVASRTSIEIGETGTIPKAYIPSDQRRLEAYRRLATALTREAIDKVRTDLADAYGDPPKPTVRLFLLAELRAACAQLAVRSVSIRDKDVVFLTTNAKPLAEKLAAAPAGQSKAIEARVSILPSQTSDKVAEVYFRPPEKYLEPETLLGVLRKRLL